MRSRPKLPGAVAAVLALTAAACSTTGTTRSTSTTWAATTGSVTTAASGSGATTATVATSTTAATPTRPKPATFQLAFTGDLLLHQGVNAAAARLAAGAPDRAYDYRPMLAPIRPWVSGADWAVCEMEVNLSADGTRLSPYPRFRAPGQVAFDVRDLGYDACTMASNHVLDHGPQGVAETLGVLDAAGLGHTGAARSAEEAAGSGRVVLGGVPVTILSYSYGFNGFAVPAAAPWTANLLDPSRVLADAATARAAGARYVVVSLHWGEQYQHQPTSTQRQLGRQLLASPDIDLVIGHHAHVVQPIEQVDGKWLVYGLGNLLSDYAQAERRDELVVVATVTVDPAGHTTTALAAVPLHLDRRTHTVWPTDPSHRADGTAPTLAAELEASWSRVQRLLTADPLPHGLSVGSAPPG